MVSITRPESRSSPGRQVLLTLVVMMAAVVLVTLSWPRLQAALLYLPVDRAIDRYYLTGELPADSIESLQQKANGSIALHEHQRYWEGLSLLYYLQAADGSRPLYLQRQSFESAVDATGRSLEMAPLQPRVWLRRAHAMGWLSFRDSGISESMNMSVYTGRVETSLLLSRLVLGYSRLGQLDDESRALLRDQTLLAWKLRKKDLVLAMRNEELDFRRVTALLVSSDIGVVREMEEAVAGRAR